MASHRLLTPYLVFCPSGAVLRFDAPVDEAKLGAVLQDKSKYPREILVRLVYCEQDTQEMLLKAIIEANKPKQYWCTNCGTEIPHPMGCPYPSRR